MSAILTDEPCSPLPWRADDLKWHLPSTWPPERVAELATSEKDTECCLGCHVPEDDPSTATERYYGAHRSEGTPRCPAAAFGRSQALRRRREIQQRGETNAEVQRDVVAQAEHEALIDRAYPCHINEVRRGDVVRWIGCWYHVISKNHVSSTTTLIFNNGRTVHLPDHRIIPTVRKDDLQCIRQKFRYVV